MSKPRGKTLDNSYPWAVSLALREGTCWSQKERNRGSWSNATICNL